MSTDKRTAVCPGTYDPVTYGHLDVIERAADMFDRLVVAVVKLPIPQKKPLFAAEERCAFVEEATGHLPNVTVEAFSNLIVDFAREKSAKAIVKGLRAIS